MQDARGISIAALHFDGHDVGSDAQRNGVACRRCLLLAHPSRSRRTGEGERREPRPEVENGADRFDEPAEHYASAACGTKFINDFRGSNGGRDRD